MSQPASESRAPASLDIHHRFFPVGHLFTAADGERQDLDAQEDLLFENEIATDLGSVCFGVKGETRMIFDHHEKKIPYPCAAVAVLENAVAIRDWAQKRSGAIWIVTHSSPDFDALCSSFLVRCIIDGSLGKVDELSLPNGDAWFSPPVAPGSEHGWAILLAAYAACVDQGRKISVRREQRLHSVLYAAMARGRDFRENGLRIFFEEVRERIQQGGNPFFDALFKTATDQSKGIPSHFGAELDFLDAEFENYSRDVSRAEKSIIRVPVSEDWTTFYRSTSGLPLLEQDSESGELCLSQAHAEAMSKRDRLDTLDAIWIENPECLLFKEWARDDFENSSMGRGFTFTAVRYVDRDLEWFFSLDPERCGTAHLYPLWAKLQRQEAEARRRLDLPIPSSDVVREGFENRARGGESWFGHDPWFDGASFNGTIVVNPGKGTLLNEGNLCKLNSNGNEHKLRNLKSPLETARTLLEDSVFVPFSDLVSEKTTKLGDTGGAKIYVWQYSVDELNSESKPVVFDRVEQLLEFDPKPNHYLFAEVRLHLPEQSEQADAIGRGLNNRLFAEQIGRKIWPVLEGRGVNTVPTDFSDRHVLVSPHRVAVWSRRGVVIAAAEDDAVADLEAVSLRGDMEEIQEISCGIKELRKLLKRVNQNITSSDREQVRALTGRVSHLRIKTSLPEGVSLRRFVEASGFDRVLEPLDQLISSIYEEQARQSEERVQRTLSFFGIALATLAIPPFVDSMMTLAGKGVPWMVTVSVPLVVVVACAVWTYCVSRKKRR